MVTTIDCHYVMPQVAAAYLLHCGEKACFIDNNTNHSVPQLMQALHDAGYDASQVEYIIITHVHLDHAGGTGLLLQQCPNAKVLAHPRAAPHVIDPSRLIQSAQSVYGAETFAKLYGDIVPVPEDRVVIPTDGQTISVGNTELTFLYTRGHANHHFVIMDKNSQSVFTGDSFGLAYPMLQRGSHPFLFPSTSPTDFDAAEARISYRKILECGASKAYPTHFGEWKDIPLGYKMLSEYMNSVEQIYNDLLADPAPDKDADYQKTYAAFKQFFDKELASRGIELTPDEQKVLEMDLDLNAQGIAFAAGRARKKGKSA